MRRLLLALTCTVVVSALGAGLARAAVEITVSVSPAESVVGRPIEVLVRTYVPVGAGDLGLPLSSLAYPAPSGLWNVLYPIPDYPFDLAARSPSGETMRVELVRDPSDASLWRGSFTPNAAGEWSVSVSNFPGRDPTRFVVKPDEGAAPTLLVGVAALLLGLIGGVIVGMMNSRRRFSPV